MNFEWTKEELEIRKELAALLTKSTADAEVLPKVAEMQNQLAAVALAGLELELGKTCLGLYYGAFHNRLANVFAASILVGESNATFAWPLEGLTAIKMDDGGLILNGKMEAIGESVSGKPILLPVQVDGAWFLCRIDAFKSTVEQPLAFDSRCLELQDTNLSSEAFVALDMPKFRQAYDLGVVGASTALMHQVFAAIKHHANEAIENGKPKMADQHVRYTIAEILTRTQAAEFIFYRAADLLELGDTDANSTLNAAKAFTSDEVIAVARDAYRIAGRDDAANDGKFAAFVKIANLLNIDGTAASDAKTAIADDLIRRYEV